MSLAKPATELHSPSGQIVRYAFVGRKPPLRAAVAVAGAFRAAVLSAFHATTGAKDSFLLSGHQPDGSPDREHSHAYYLPEPSEDGTCGGILVVSPKERFSKDELDALRVVKALRWDGPSTRLDAEMLAIDDTSSIQVANHWVSATPYVPLRRYWGTHGKHHLTPEKQLMSELLQLGCGGGLANVKVNAWGDVQVRVKMATNLGAAMSAIRRHAFKIDFRTHEPMCGPIALGHSSHFGLGLFVPVSGD